MSLGNTFGNDLMKLIFNGTAIANIADNAASSPLTSIYISLHSAEPSAAGSQTTSEISYTGYTRKAITRNSGGWTVSGMNATNADTVSFDACTGGTATATHFVIGTASSGTGKILVIGSLTSSLAISSGITPQFPAGALTGTAI